MCGAIGNIANDPLVILAYEILKQRQNQTRTTNVIEQRNVRPMMTFPVIVENQGERKQINAVWSVLIEKKNSGNGFRAMKSKRDGKPYKTFNARAAMLQKSPTWKPLFQSHRCIVPASYFHEWAGKQCFKIAPVDTPLTFAGLYKTWHFDEQVVNAFSIITLPGHPKLQHIHKQSVPLILTEKDYDQWLDPNFTHVEAFASLLHSHVPIDLQAVMVNSVTELNPVAESETIKADSEV